MRSLSHTVKLAALGAVMAANGITANAQSVHKDSPIDSAFKERAEMSARLDRVLEDAVQQQRIVGAVAVVAQDGKVLYRKAVGMADREAQIPMRPDTVFRLASMSKPIVTVAAMRLVELGKLSLDAPVTQYLPDFRPSLTLEDGSERQPTITVRQLITHTSGLGYGFAEGPEGAYAKLGVSDGIDNSGISLKENLKRLAKAPLYFSPGSQWRYSLGIDVLGAVLEQVEQTPLPQVVSRYVTKPLGMSHTGFVAMKTMHLATPYADGNPPIRMTENIEVPLPDGIGVAVRFSPARAFDSHAFASGGGGMLGNADDYLRFLESVRMATGVLSPETMSNMRIDHVGAQAQTQGPGWGFGYGWGVLSDPVAASTPQSQGTLQWGGAYGHNWFVDPQRKISVVLLTNTAFEGMAGTLVYQVRDAVYEGLNLRPTVD